MRHKKMFEKNSKGFTLLEILLVVALISILAGIVIVAINPGKQLADTRNAQRRVDVNTILNAVYQYDLDAQAMPAGIATDTACGATATNEICKTGGTCTNPNLVDLSVLTNAGKYLVAMPTDPSNPATNVNGTGYFVNKDANGRITVCAKNAENSATISVTR